MQISLYGRLHDFKLEDPDRVMIEESLGGYYDPTTADIRVSIQSDIRGKSCHREIVRNAIIHELVHACADDTGVDYDMDETLVSWIARAYQEIEKVLPEIDVLLKTVVKVD